MPKIIHYPDKCIGCGICQEMQPDIWRMSKTNGKAVLLHATVKKGVQQLMIHASLQSLSQQVAKACPARIIKLL
jgi:ferredoxin